VSRAAHACFLLGAGYVWYDAPNHRQACNSIALFVCFMIWLCVCVPFAYALCAQLWDGVWLACLHCNKICIGALLLACERMTWHS
jgi:hypothetical protein